MANTSLTSVGNAADSLVNRWFAYSEERTRSRAYDIMRADWKRSMHALPPMISMSPSHEEEATVAQKLVRISFGSLLILAFVALFAMAQPTFAPPPSSSRTRPRPHHGGGVTPAGGGRDAGCRRHGWP
jgi:hypothetical protein